MVPDKYFCIQSLLILSRIQGPRTREPKRYELDGLVKRFESTGTVQNTSRATVVLPQVAQGIQQSLTRCATRPHAAPRFYAKFYVKTLRFVYRRSQEIIIPTV